jgi:hypothetical protein
MELREQIIAAIKAATWPTNYDEVEGIDTAADAILNLPEIRDALAYAEDARRRREEGPFADPALD